LKGIGNTPLIRLQNIEKEYGLSCELYAKLENENAGGSVKDRVALSIIDSAEREGRLQKGGCVIEATSGNTGIGLALVCRQRGYKAVIVMPDTMTVERRQMIAGYGAEVVLTDGKKGMQGAVEKAEELHKTTPNSIIAGQFVNPANPLAHYTGTGVEIYKQTDGEIDIFLACVGTGGTLTGVGKYLKEQNPQIKVFAVEPKNSPLLSKGYFGAHKIQGIGANFIPETLDKSVYDSVLTVDDNDAIATMKRLKEQENLFVGISSGAVVCAAIELLKGDEYAGKTAVVVLPDSGDRYLSIW
jgi:cysteine synthase A